MQRAMLLTAIAVLLAACSSPLPTGPEDGSRPSLSCDGGANAPSNHNCTGGSPGASGGGGSSGGGNNTGNNSNNPPTTARN